MKTKRRSPGQTSFSVSMSAELLADIDARATALGLNRSQYLVQLAHRDTMSGGDFVIYSAAAPAETLPTILVPKTLAEAKRQLSPRATAGKKKAHCA